MARRRTLGAVLLAALVAGCAGGGDAATTWDDRVGEAAGGPDLAAVTVSDTSTEVTFEVRFAEAPPLGVGEDEGWVDMLLIGIDVPPLGPEPDRPGGEWRGADFALGTHGPSPTGMLVRLGAGGRPADVEIVSEGSTLTLSVPRSALGDPDWFTFSVAAAREEEDETGGGGDVLPASGTLRYTLGG